MVDMRSARHERHPGAGILASAVCALVSMTVLVDMSLDRAAQAKEIEVTVTGGRLSLEAEEVALADLLRAIGEAAAIEVTVRGDLGNVGRRSLVDEPLAAGIRRLLGRHSVLMLYDRNAAGEPRLREIKVEAAGTVTAATGRSVGRPAGRGQRGGGAVAAGIRSYQQLAVLDSAARIEAVRELAGRQDEVATGVLAETLQRDGNAAVRRLAANALSDRSRGEDAVAALTVALNDAERAIRIQALRGLRANLGDRLAPLLVDVVTGDQDPVVRRAAVQLASSLQGEEARQVIELALEDADETVRRVAEAAAR